MKEWNRLFGFIIVISMLVLVGCGQRGKQLPQILVSPKGLVHNFWVTVKAGADSAGAEFGAEIIWKGPTQETDVAGQIAIIEDYVIRKVDAIVLAACDTRALVPVVKKAHDAGIPIITIDSGLDSEFPLSFVATDNIKAASLAADALSGMLEGKGQVALIPFVPGAATSMMREEGFTEGLKRHPGLDLVAVQYSQSDVATAMAVMENILTAHPKLGGVFAANEAGTLGVMQALTGRGLAGKVKLVAFDAAEDEIKGLLDGKIDALIVQDPFKMGYLGVKAALDAMAGKQIEKRIDTGVYVVTRENYEEPAVQKVLYPLGR